MNEETIEKNEMGILPIGKLLRKMSIPLIISMFVQVLYGLVDSMYVARLGDSALTAISLSMPVQYLVVGVGVGIGVGVNSVLSKKLGEQDEKGVRSTSGNGLLMVWILSILFIILGIFAMEPFYRMQTNIQEVIDMSVSYSRILCVVSFAALHQLLFERLLSSTGKANLTMISMFIGAVVNIILDPIMIFGWFGLPRMGISGAAYATVIAQTVAAISGLILNLKKNHDVKFSKKGLKPNREIVTEIIKIGVPALRIVAASLVLTTTTQILNGFLQSMGKGTDSFIIAISQAVFLLASAWILSLTKSAVLVWLAFPIMEIIRFAMAVVFSVRTHRQFIKPIM